MQHLDIGNVKMPLNAATKTFAILAKRGAGKSYTGAVLAEEFASANVPFVVFDPIDVWWGLRVSADGKSAGLPVVVFGNDPRTSDIPLTKDMGRDIARAVTSENVSVVISTFGLPKTHQRHIVTEFSEELMRLNANPRHVFIEEAHEFVPQRVFGEIGKCFGAVSALVTMGRNRGIGVTLISQRAATVNKDVLTQLDTLIALRSVGPQDRKALSEWVEFHSAAGDFEKFMQSLPTLPTGEAWLWSPEFLQTFERIKIRKRKTFHPDREKMDATFRVPTLDAAQVKDFIGRFESRPKAEEKGEKKAAVKKPLAVAAPTVNEAALRNEYESQLIAKDARIRELENEKRSFLSIIDQFKKILSVNVLENAPPLTASSGSSQMWIDKLRTSNKQASVVLEFLTKNSGLLFSISQIALGCGYSAGSGGFNSAIALLKRNRLITERDRRWEINPSL